MSIKQLLKLLSISLAGLLIFGCAGKQVSQDEFSGYLDDYSQLEKEKDKKGEAVLRFVSPRLNHDNYQKVLIEPVQYFPEPNPTDKVSSQTLDDIKKYIDEEFKKQVNERVAVVDQPGPGVIRMRVALTAVGAETENLKAYQYVPAALVLTAGQAAVQGRPKQAVLYLEAEMSDSVSGERLAIAVRGGTGERLKKLRQEAGPTVSLDSLKPLLDQWADAYTEFVFQNLGSN